MAISSSCRCNAPKGAHTRGGGRAFELWGPDLTDVGGPFPDRAGSARGATTLSCNIGLFGARSPRALTVWSEVAHGSAYTLSSQPEKLTEYKDLKNETLPTLSIFCLIHPDITP